MSYKIPGMKHDDKNPKTDEKHTEENERDIRDEMVDSDEGADQAVPADEPKQDDYKDKYVRLLSEFANYQKQKEAESKSIVKFANSNLILKFLDILDDIENGLMQDETSEETRNILEMLKSKMLHTLSLEGVEPIKLERGDDYDSSKAEVVTTIDDEENKGRISQVIRKGYTYTDRVLRTAKVIVGK